KTKRPQDEQQHDERPKHASLLTLWRFNPRATETLLFDLLQWPRVLQNNGRLPRRFPGADDDARRRADRLRQPPLENRLHLREELLEVVVVVEILAGDRFGVGLQDRLDQLVAGQERFESRVAWIRDRFRWRWRQRQARLEALDQIPLEAGMNAVVACELPVVVVGGVKRLVRILDVVPRPRRKKD